MVVDTQALITELEQYGTVEFCDINNERSYVIVVNNYNSDESTFLNLVNTYIIQDYPNQIALTIADGVLKSEFDK